MLTMQYTIVLPAAFDMEVIRARIATKGPLLDHFPGLRFKAYLHASRGEHGAENLYAPFYLWADTAAMTRFVSGPGFAALTNDFGWPVVRTGVPFAQELRPGFQEARFATSEQRPIAPHADLAALAETERRLAAADADDTGALAAVATYNPSTWTLVRLRLWGGPRDVPDGMQRYAVGHVSAPGD